MYIEIKVYVVYLLDQRLQALLPWGCLVIQRKGKDEKGVHEMCLD